MTPHQAILAGSAYFAGFITVLLWMRSKITQNLGDQAPDENGSAGAGGANGIGHFDSSSNPAGRQDHV